MKSVSTDSNRVVSFGEKVSYGITEIACNPMYTIFCSFLVFFYTDVIGVNAAAVGTIILISRIFDGFSDIIAGNIVEHTHAKSGSARPWILRIAIPLGISYIAMFTVPDCGEWGKLIYIFVSYNVIQSVVYTMANAAMSALPTYMTNDRNSRSSCYAVRLFIAAATQTVLSLKFMNIIDALGGGQRAWIKLAAILGTIAAIVFAIVYMTTRETVTSGGENGEDVPLLVGLKALMHNKYWFSVLAMQFCCVLHQVTTLTVGVYYAKYILNDAKLVGNIIMYHHFPALVVMLLVPIALDKGASKRTHAGDQCYGKRRWSEDWQRSGHCGIRWPTHNVRLQRHGRSADRKRCKLHPYYLHRCADRDLSDPHCSGMAVQAGQAVPADSEGVGGAQAQQGFCELI